jgi:hypothetical protein
MQNTALRIAPLALALALVTPSARALDKQGSAHGGDIAGAENGFDFSGSAALGVSLYNPSYAARPDNTGLTLMRYAAHADIDLIGRRLSIPVDVNMFTDRKRDGFGKLVPTEFDLITGVTSTHAIGKGALEVGARVEHDRQVGPNVASETADVNGQDCGHGGLCSQTYVDLRARYLYSLAALDPALGKALVDGDVLGWATLGFFAINPTYAARPDNSGKALFRYALHTELSLFHDYISFGNDFTLFTDRKAGVVVPSEVDWTPELIGSIDIAELHLAYERDMPLGHGASDESTIPANQRGHVQQFIYLLAVWNFDFVTDVPRPMEHEEEVPSP